MSRSSPPSPGCETSGEHAKNVTSQEAVLAAIRGLSVPSEMLEGKTLHPPPLQAVVCGIRRHANFASSPDVEKIHPLGVYPAVSRAQAARLIMSNQVPELDADKPETIPYCIWHPAVASEESYRQLAERYPVMRYHVGRAYAIGGIHGVVSEARPPSDVAIAEEARDNGSYEIFDDIMSRPARFAIMNDYNLTVTIETPNFRPFLNGDATVRSFLDRQVSLEDLI